MLYDDAFSTQGDRLMPYPSGCMIEPLESLSKIVLASYYTPDRVRRRAEGGPRLSDRSPGLDNGQEVVLRQIEDLTADMEAWRAYAKALNKVRVAEKAHDGPADMEAKRHLASAMGNLRKRGFDPLEEA
jgi:hypothetical protein